MNSKIADSINFIPVHRLARAAVSIISYLTCLAESSPLPFLSLSLSLFPSGETITRRDIRRSLDPSLYFAVSSRLPRSLRLVNMQIRRAFFLSLSLSLGQQTSIEIRDKLTATDRFLPNPRVANVNAN